MRRTVASKLVLGGIEGTSLSSQESQLLEKFPLRGLTLFKRNISCEAQVKSLNFKLKQIDASFEIAVDQEGGRVSRLRNFALEEDLFPDEGAAGNLDLSEQGWADYGQRVGNALEALGFTINFAPVVDVLTNPQNACIGDRAFASTAEAVVQKAGSFLQGQNLSSVKGVLKHFPGQGDAEVDTHLGAATVGLSPEELLTVHVKPFIDLSLHAHGIMTAHSSYPLVDDLPASISRKWITETLREKIGFKGLVYSDDFLMHAIPQDTPSWNEAIIEGLSAGLNVILICRHLEKSRQAVEAIETKMKSSKAFEAIVENRVWNNS